MSSENLVTLTQDEIDRFSLKDKQVGDVITAAEYSELSRKALKKDNKEEAETEADKPAKKSDKK